MKIAICDDVLECVDDIKSNLEKTNISAQEYEVFQSGEDLLNKFDAEPLKYDIIFLDMEMKGLNGIDTGKLIREKNEDVVIIFVTSYENYMKQSFECRPFRFLTKPINYEEFINTVVEAQKHLAKRKKICTIQDNKNTIRLLYDDIIYCECIDHFLWITTKNNNKYRCYMTLNEFCKTLDNTSLVRVHKSFVVNLRYVERIKEKCIVLYDRNEIIPLGRSYRKSTMHEYNDYFERSLYI